MAYLQRVSVEDLEYYEVPSGLLEQIRIFDKGHRTLDRAVWLVPVIAVALAYFNLATGAQAFAFAGFGYLFVAITRCENRAVRAAIVARKDIAILRQELAYTRAQLTAIEDVSARNS